VNDRLKLGAHLGDISSMRVIVCDDDELVRSVVATVVEERGHAVVGEAEDQHGALELLRQLEPDIAIVDLALRFSTGVEVVRTAWERGCRVIIFSSFITPDLLHATPGGPVAIEKPHFEGLGEALDQVANSVTAQVHDRRCGDRGDLRGPGFSQAVAEAVVGDVVVILEPGPEGGALLDVVGLTAARITAACDRSETTARQVRLLLALAGEGGARAVISRLEAKAGVDLSSWSQRIAVVTEAGGAVAFERIVSRAV
jgi:chemotaxis response regulator CheB